MNPHQWFLMGLRAGQQPNTFIGGVASTINTAQLLADKLLNTFNDSSIGAGNIENFTVIGNDIQCFIKVDYRIATDAFRDNLDIKYYKDTGNKLKKLRQRVFQGANNMTEFEAEGLQQIAGGLVFSNTAIKKLIFPNLTIVDSDAFANFTTEPVPQRFFYLPIVQDLGRTVGDDTVFLNIKPGSIIITNPALQTINDGSEDGDLVRARNFGAEIRYKTNSTAPNPVTDLAVSQVWEDAVKLSWTIPSSTNAIDYYELYQNGVFVKNVREDVGFATNLTPSTNYSFKLIPFDIFFNKGTVSNEVSQTTNALGSGKLNIISSYRLDSNLVDVVNGYNGIGKAITYGAGKVGNAAVMTNGFINLNRNDIVGGKSEFSISCWFKNNANQRNVIYGSWAASFSIIVRWDSGNLQFITYTSAQSGGTFATIPYDNVWRHIVATYDGTTMKMYVNGVLLGTTFAQTGALNNGSQSEHWGRYGSFTSNMSLDAGHIFNTALTATEVSNLYAFEDAGGQLI